jgi:signal transduction histidine kinase
MIALTLYRFAQEALTNVAKHAEADHIEMKLQMDAEKIFLSVTDNGVGFRAPIDLESQTKAAGIGLAGMYERLETIGGTLEIHSKPKQGTTLVASVPLREE